jgi:hypothetical protein
LEAEDHGGPSHSHKDDVLEEEDEDDFGKHTHSREIPPDSKFENNQTGIVNWPPSSLEIESLVTGQPITIKVHLTNGEPVLQAVDEATTVEQLFDRVRESHAYFKSELETESFWLYRLHETKDNSSHNYDFPLPKDKRILKLMYQAER